MKYELKTSRATHRAQVTPVALACGVLGHNAGHTAATATRADGLAVVRLFPQVYQYQVLMTNTD